MSVVAPEVLRERAERYAARNPEATLPEVLGRFRLDPTENSDERTVVENALAARSGPDAPRETADETGGVRA